MKVHPSLGVGQGACFFGNAMPKAKTHKASRKRFRVTATGKLKRSQAGKKHLNSPKTAKRKRQLRAKITDAGKLARKYVQIMGEA